MLTRDTAQCAKGITLWAVREALRDEVVDNPEFLSLISRVVGGGKITRLLAVKRIGLRYDLILEAETRGGYERRLFIATELDGAAAPCSIPGPFEIEYREPVRGRRGEFVCRQATAIQFAPRTWFEKRRIAPGLTFERAMRAASPPPFKTACDRGSNEPSDAFSTSGSRGRSPTGCFPPLDAE